MSENLTFRLAGARSSLAFKAPCRCAALVNITLSGFQTINGEVFASTDDAAGLNTRVLLTAQTDATQNGIWVPSSGNWSRARDFDGNEDIVKGTRVYCEGGTVGATTYVVTSSDPIVIGTSSIAFATEQSLIGSAVEFLFDGGGAPIIVGQMAWIEMPFAGTITQNTMLADQAGTMAVDLRLDSYANYPPAAGDSIVASAPPTLTAAAKSVDTTLTGWTTTVARGDILLAIVTSTSAVIKQLTLSLRLNRSAS